MRIRISAPSILPATTIHLSASKSISNRALIINALSKGQYIPENLSDCDDTNVMIKALTGNNEIIDIMAAGTAMRFLTAYLSVTEGERIITGTQRMQQRPIRILVDALRELGADITYIDKEGFPPLRIRGQELNGSEIKLQGNISSQYISALLMIAPVLKNGLRLHLTGEIISRPYINLTLQLMKEFGAKAEWISEDTIYIYPQPYTSVPFTVESDRSAASYWYQIVALAQNDDAEIRLPGRFQNSYQGDSKVAGIFEKLGVRTTFNQNEVILSKSGEVTPYFEYNFIDQPDLAQTFAVTCCMLNIPFRFSGLQTLKIKETDRISALIKELGKLGFIIQEKNDSILSWNGDRTDVQASPVIDTYEDHRMAMAFAPACLKIKSIEINEPEVVSKSYPGYWKDLASAGFTIE